jgi:hypothetical protein
MINTFQIGCDPEFVALDKDSKLIKTEFVTDEDLDAAAETEVGFDHNGRVIELRPKPTQGTFALCRRLQRLVNAAIEQFPNVSKFRAGATCGGESLGGHVHFGIPMYAQNYVTTQDLYGRTVTVPMGSKVEDKVTKIIPALDKVTYIFEHLDILPMGESANRRKGRYGKWGEIRDSDGHVEYRTMASWLYDPRVSFLCLTAAKLAAAEPQSTLDALGKVTSFEGVEKWMGLYKDKDANARRAVEKVFPKGLKAVQIDPDVDFRERWKELGI